MFCFPKLGGSIAIKIQLHISITVMYLHDFITPFQIFGFLKLGVCITITLWSHISITMICFHVTYAFQLLSDDCMKIVPCYCKTPHITTVTNKLMNEPDDNNDSTIGLTTPFTVR